jgi:hypothetical protein
MYTVEDPNLGSHFDSSSTHTRYGRSHVHTIGHLTNTRSSDGAPETDGDLREVVRKKILHYHQLYIDHPEPIAFFPVVVDTSDRVYDDFSRLGVNGVDFGEGFGHEDFYTDPKDVVLRINLNIDGVSVESRSHTHPSHSEISR